MNDISIQSNEFYKSLYKHIHCSKCNIILTRDIYKKGRSVCKVCYNNGVLTYYKNKFGSNSAIKIDISTQTEFLDLRDGLINQDISTSKSSSNICDNSNKKIISKKRNTEKDNLIIQDNNNITDTDPNCLMDKFTELYKSKYTSIEEAQVAREHCKKILNELLRVKALTNRMYDSLYKKCEV